MINMNNIDFAYSNKQVLKNFNLNVDKGECIAIVGESGKGKTTILRLISGLEKVNQGEIIINDKIANNKKTYLHPKDRSVGMVFQDAALFPHLNVYKNISYACKDDDFINELLNILAIEDIKYSKVYELSGGQQQRVAIARTLATKPSVLLLDEPFSNIDETNSNNIKDLIYKLIKKYQLTTIIISHDSSDYEDIADRIITI